MLRTLVVCVAALILTIASAAVPWHSDEQIMYGYEGPVEQNLLRRKLAGWPAAYIADNPNTSVPHQIGPEDNLRPGAFVGTLSFWFLVASFLASLIRKARRKRPESSLAREQRGG